MRLAIVTSLLFAVSSSPPAQTPTLQLGAIYECPALGVSMKVVSCAGPGAGEPCDVQALSGPAQGQRRPAPRQQVIALVQTCHLQTEAESKARAHGGPAAGGPVGAGGFKTGDTVQVLTAGGWMNATVLQVRGNSYYVHAQIGADVWKSYPAGVRRGGKLTAEDHANGQYDLKDRVQVNVQGRWTEGEISGIFGNQFEVKLAGNRTVDTTAENLRPSTAPAPVARQASQSPKPGLASCAGKFEGRYAPSNGMGGLSIVFRSGKATATVGLGGAEEFECWTGGGKIYLYDAGKSDGGISLDVNSDGTLDTPFGEVKKKGN